MTIEFKKSFLFLLVFSLTFFNPSRVWAVTNQAEFNQKFDSLMTSGKVEELRSFYMLPENKDFRDGHLKSYGDGLDQFVKRIVDTAHTLKKPEVISLLKAPLNFTPEKLRAFQIYGVEGGPTTLYGYVAFKQAGPKALGGKPDYRYLNQVEFLGLRPSDAEYDDLASLLGSPIDTKVYSAYNNILLAKTGTQTISKETADRVARAWALKFPNKESDFVTFLRTKIYHNYQDSPNARSQAVLDELISYDETVSASAPPAEAVDE